MDYYDIAADSCNIDATIEKKLGFKKIFKISIDSKNSKIVYQNNFKLKKLIKLNKISAVICDDYKIDKKLLKLISKNKIILCIPIPNTKQRFNLSRDLYKISNLFLYSNKNKILATFITFAKSNKYLCSYIQLIEFAKFIGADDQYAKFCLSEINKILIQKINNDKNETKT
ncbi:MAG: hypothetical protein M1168_03070 [Candidatus Marsarchaeota archaeon]|nr:hypothetical protein [Candidatus Marsarchaeota archaeon]MCL5094936.1 hypothetical protein [Candidatus Marsarchaeota archaeon]